MDNRITTLISSIGRLREYDHTIDDIKAVKNALNAFFMPKAKCTNFVYTVNTDKLPFGCVIFPNFNGRLSSFLIDRDIKRFEEYEIEIDSKMFDYGLTDEEIAQVMIYNIHHMTDDATPLERLEEQIDLYFMETDNNIKIRSSLQYNAILEFGCVDALNQLVNCLNLPNDVLSDAYLESLELFDFKIAIDKLFRQIPDCDNEVTRQPKLSMLAWSFRLYDNVAEERIPAIHLLNKAKAITASALYHAKFNMVINAMNRIDTDLIAESAMVEVLTESKKRKGLIASLKYNGLRDIEADLYEFTLRAKNAETEEEVIYALKQINARLAILDDYIRENPEDPDIERWINVKIQYEDLRTQLAKKKTSRHSYGVFVDYDALDKLDDDEE